MNQPGLLPAQITQFNQSAGKSDDKKNDAAKNDAKKNNSKNDAKKNNSKNDVKKNDAAKNDAKKNSNSNKSNNSNNSNKSTNSNNSSNLDNFTPELDKRYIPFWVLILLANVFIVLNYIITPIRYSEEKIEGVVS